MNGKGEESLGTGCSGKFCGGKELVIHVEYTVTENSDNGQVGTAAWTKLIMNILGKVG